MLGSQSVGRKKQSVGRKKAVFGQEEAGARTTRGLVCLVKWFCLYLRTVRNMRVLSRDLTELDFSKMIPNF